MITNIPRSKLEPHPDNPRKDLGDLTDLAASIKRSGVLQNLTAVPSPDHPDMYRIVIGHRRHAAAGLAGVDELPCAIEDMSYADQVATMLAENMQRNDLTIADQVGHPTDDRPRRECQVDLDQDRHERNQRPQARLHRGVAQGGNAYRGQ